MFRLTLSMLTALLLVAVSVAQTPEAGKQIEQQLKIGDQEVGYLLFLPKSYDASESQIRWPLMVFLHGAGERGADLSLVKKHGPPKIVESKTDFPFIVVSPQCPKGTYWNVEHVKQVIDKVRDSFNVDKERVSVSGLSMGGFGSWSIAAKYPDDFAAVAPICGGGKPGTAAELLHIPIWAFHGDADKVVPISGSTKIVDAINQLGGSKVILSIYEGVGHDSWTQTYDNPMLYDWLLSQRRDNNLAAKKMYKPNDTAAPQATIDDVSWISGSWSGQAMGSRFEETWNPPSAGTMVGMFKFIKEEEVAFYEILTIVEQGGTLMLRLKHFSPGLEGWEEKEKSIEFPLVSVSQSEARFDGLTLSLIHI